MNLRSIDLNLLVVFDAIFRAGNISVAAQQIGMSQPAASNALTRFRSLVDDPLFIRNPTGVTPTQKARELAEPIRQALTLLESTLEPRMGYDYTKDNAPLLIAMEELSELILVPRLVSRMRQIAPGIRVGVSQETGAASLDALRKGTLDMSLEYAREALPTEYRSRILFQEERVAVVRRDHESIGNSLSLETYLRAPHVVLNQRVRGATSVNAFLEKKGWKRNIALEIPTYLSVPTVLMRTDFVATMPRRVASHLAEFYPLKIFRLPFAMAPLQFELIWHESRSGSARHEWMRNTISNLIGE